MTLRANSYAWEFVPIAGKTFRDSGTATCSGSATTPTNTLPATTATTTAPVATTTPPSTITSRLLYLGNDKTGQIEVYDIANGYKWHTRDCDTP